MPALHVLNIAIRDASQGPHARGILQALARLGDVQTRRIEVARRVLIPNWALAGLVRRTITPATLLDVGYGMSLAKVPKARLIVADQPDVLGAAIAISRAHDAKTIVFGPIGPYRPESFNLILSAHTDATTSLREVRSLKPSPLDPATLPRISKKPGTSGISSAGLIVGAGSQEAPMSRNDWGRIAHFLAACHETYGTRWHVITSPETPADAEAVFARLVADPQSPIERFRPRAANDEAQMREVFAASEAIACTADMSSAISDAVWCQRPVIILEPARVALDAAEINYRRYLETNGHVRTREIAVLTPKSFMTPLETLTPLNTNPLDDIAGVIRQTFGESLFAE